MAKQHRREPKVPACYAMVIPGLESVAAEEITADLGGDVRKVSRGLVIFRVPEIGPQLFSLRTTEDVFLLGWGSGSLTYRAEDLKSIKSWTESEADWRDLLALQQRLAPRRKGKPTYRVVTQMHGTHGYRRVDAGKALSRAIAGRVPSGWSPVDEDAHAEIWLTIRGKVAVCGVRLSDREMRHRTYKSEHLPASLRPSLAAAMVRLGGASPGMTVLDPMCGGGTILAEQIALSRARKAGIVEVWGGDLDANALAMAGENVRRVGPCSLGRWDARSLPFAPGSVDRVVCNPPFGKQLSSPKEIGPLYRALVREIDRALRPNGRVVLLASDPEPLREPIRRAGWEPKRQMEIQILGQDATLGVWRKRD